MLPNSSSAPITERIRQAIGDKLPLFTSDTKRETLTQTLLVPLPASNLPVNMHFSVSALRQPTGMSYFFSSNLS